MRQIQRRGRVMTRAECLQWVEPDIPKGRRNDLSDFDDRPASLMAVAHHHHSIGSLSLTPPDDANHDIARSVLRSVLKYFPASVNADPLVRNSASKQESASASSRPACLHVVEISYCRNRYLPDRSLQSMGRFIAGVVTRPDPGLFGSHSFSDEAALVGAREADATIIDRPSADRHLRTALSAYSE